MYIIYFYIYIYFSLFKYFHVVLMDIQYGLPTMVMVSTALITPRPHSWLSDQTTCLLALNQQSLGQAFGTLLRTGKHSATMEVLMKNSDLVLISFQQQLNPTELRLNSPLHSCLVDLISLVQWRIPRVEGVVLSVQECQDFHGAILEMGNIWSFPSPLDIFLFLF